MIYLLLTLGKADNVYKYIVLSFNQKWHYLFGSYRVEVVKKQEKKKDCLTWTDLIYSQYLLNVFFMLNNGLLHLHRLLFRLYDESFSEKAPSGLMMNLTVHTFPSPFKSGCELYYSTP